MARRFRRHKNDAPELNITAFLNLMVVLIPFLLLTAVFSQITILDLNLPTDAGDPPPDQKPKLTLEIIVRPDALDIRDRNTGRIAYVKNNAEGYNLGAMRDALYKIKQQFLDISAVSVLLEEETPYNSLIMVMDTVRSFPTTQEDGSPIEYELFPDISIGDAPLRASAEKKK